MRKDILKIHTQTLSYIIKDRYKGIPPKTLFNYLSYDESISIDILENKTKDKSLTERESNYIKTEMDRALYFLSNGVRRKNKNNKTKSENSEFKNTLLIKETKSRTETYYRLNDILQIGKVDIYNVSKNLYMSLLVQEEDFDIYDEAIREITHRKQKKKKSYDDDIDFTPFDEIKIRKIKTKQLVQTLTAVNCFIKESKSQFNYTLNEMLNIIAFDISIDINIKFNESEFKLSNVKPKQLIYNDESIDIKFEECQFRIKSFEDIKFIESSNKDSIDEMIKKSESILSEYDTDNVNNFRELINQYKSIKESFEF